MGVAFLYNDFKEDPAYSPDELVPLGMPVAEALERLGHDVVRIACTLNLASVRHRLESTAPDVAFNHVESLGGSDQVSAAVALLLDAMDIPYTGCPSEAIVATTSKITTKNRLHEAGLPTPPWYERDHEVSPELESSKSQSSSRFIIKAIYEHASFKLSSDSVVTIDDLDQLPDVIRAREDASSKRHFAERYIDGREFNLSLLGRANSGGVDVLPPAEIRFDDYPADRPRIVCHRAKSVTHSFEYNATPRTFEHDLSDSPLLDSLSRLARDVWRRFGLRGYARVDFRVDEANRPWILEINANPCLAPDAGFAAALEQAGIGYDAGMQRILDAAAVHTPRATVANL